MTFLENEKGHPYTAETFGNRFRAWARAAGLAQSAFNRLSAGPGAGEVSHSSAPTPKWDEDASQPIDEKDAETWMVPRTGREDMFPLKHLFTNINSRP